MELKLTDFKPEPHKQEPELQELTDNFIQQFLDAAAKKETERNDSFAFNYTLIDCILKSKYVENNIPREGWLIGMGLVDNFVKGMFEHNIKGITQDILFIINNFNKQPKYDDYYAYDYVCEEKNVDVDDFNISLDDHNKLNVVKVVVNKLQTTVSFSLKNSRSGCHLKTRVIFLEGVLEDVGVENASGELILTINKYDKPTIQHYKHIAEINSFTLLINQIKYLIKEVIDEN